MLRAAILIQPQVKYAVCPWSHMSGNRPSLKAPCTQDFLVSIEGMVQVIVILRSNGVRDGIQFTGVCRAEGKVVNHGEATKTPPPGKIDAPAKGRVLCGSVRR